MSCSALSHLLLKARIARGNVDRVSYVGVQCAEAPDPEPLLLYNCHACGSTLAVAVHPSEAADAWVRRTVRGPGRVITEADTREVEGIRSWLPGALCRAGLHLEQVPGGWRAVSIGPRRPTPTGPMCVKCGAAIALIN